MATINYLTVIEFDFGAVGRLADSVRALGMRRPMLVTDAGLAAGPVLARVLDTIGEFYPVVFDGTPQNPDEVTDDMIPRMVEGALKDHSTATNPRPVSRDDFQQLFAQAMGSPQSKRRGETKETA